MHELLLETKTVSYVVKRNPRRRKVSLEVLPGEVVLRVPQRMGNHQVPAILRQHSAWLLHWLAALEEVRIQTRRKYITGERFPYLGKTYSLNVIHRMGMREPYVALKRGRIWVQTNANADDGALSHAISQALLCWYRARALVYLMRRTEILSEVVGLNPTKVTVSSQSRLWGSCSAKGSIRLNWRLILAPIPVVDYVIAHELCHLKVTNHSPAFWTVLLGVDPRFAKHRDWLKANAWYLRLWFDNGRHRYR